MSNVLLIAKRDFAGYLHGFAGYAIIATVLFLDGVAFNAFALGTGARLSHEVVSAFFYLSFVSTLIASLLLSMRAFAEEYSQGTDVLLRTSPISAWQMVAGKYLGVMGMIAVFVGLTVHMPALVMWNGKVSLGHLAVGYTGLLAVGSAGAAIGVFGSSLFRSQVAAAVVSTGIVVFSALLVLFSALTDPPFSDLLFQLDIYAAHFEPFQQGRLELSGLVYYASVTFVFLWLTATVLKGRRWE